MTTVLIIVLLVLLLGGVPLTYQSWGALPSGGLGFVLLVVIIVLLLGRG